MLQQEVRVGIEEEREEGGQTPGSPAVAAFLLRATATLTMVPEGFALKEGWTKCSPQPVLVNKAMYWITNKPIYHSRSVLQGKRVACSLNYGCCGSSLETQAHSRVTSAAGLPHHQAELCPMGPLGCDSELLWSYPVTRVVRFPQVQLSP